MSSFVFDLHHETVMEVVSERQRRYQNVYAAAPVTNDDYIPTEYPKPESVKRLIRGALEKNKFSEVFKQFRVEELNKFILYMESETVPEGGLIMQQGDEGDNFYVIESGSVTIEVNGKRVATGKAGDSFGELALIYGSPRAATIKARATTKLWKVDRDTFRNTMAKVASKSRGEIMAALRSVDLLSTLKDPELSAIADVVFTKSFNKGQKIISKGEEGKIFYMVKEGSVLCTDAGSSGQFKDQVLGPGMYFGERALLTDEPRAANVTAQNQPTVVLSLHREDFDKLLGPLHETISKDMGRTLLNSIEVLSNLTEKEMDSLVKKFMAEDGEKVFEDGDVIVEEGTRGTELFIIKTGSADVMTGSVSKKNVVKTLEQGDYFGEMALLTDGVRNASVVAKGNVTCFALDKEYFDQIVGGVQKYMKRNAKKRSAELDSVYKDRNKIDLRFEDLVAIANLGQGTFGRVKLMRHLDTRKGGQKLSETKVYALKIISKSLVVSHHQQANVMNERDVMLKCDHPFLLKLYNTYRDRHNLYLLLEFVQGGELFSVIHTSSSDGLIVRDARFYAACTVTAVGYLHSKNIAYRDLKPENMLIDSTGYIKMVDFGFAKEVTNKTYTLCGTPEYLAPEIVMGRGHGTGVDWWAVGILIYEMIAGYSPFSDPMGYDQVVICQNIVNGTLRFKGFERSCKQLISMLLKREPHERLGCGYGGEERIREHAWFREIDWDKLLRKELRAPWVPPLAGNSDTSHFDGAELDEVAVKVDTSGWDIKFGEPTTEAEAAFLSEKEQRYLKKVSSQGSFFEDSSILGPAASNEQPGTYDIFSKAMCIDDNAANVQNTWCQKPSDGSLPPPDPQI